MGTKDDILRILRWMVLPLAVPLTLAMLLYHGNAGPRQQDIIADLDSPDEDTREVALYWSGALRLPSFLPHVAKHFDEGRRTRRKLAVQAFAKGKDPMWGEALLGAFRRQPDLRDNVITSLKMVYHPETIPWLEKIAEESPEYRDFALDSIDVVRRIMSMETLYYTPGRRIYNRFGYVIFSQLAIFPEGRAVLYGFQPDFAEREKVFQESKRHAPNDGVAGS